MKKFILALTIVAVFASPSLAQSLLGVWTKVSGPSMVMTYHYKDISAFSLLVDTGGAMSGAYVLDTLVVPHTMRWYVGGRQANTAIWRITDDTLEMQGSSGDTTTFPASFSNASHYVREKVSPPKILGTLNVPSAGYTASVSVTTPPAGQLNVGANQTWELRSLTFTPVGTATVLDPSSSPFASSFPTANFAFSIGNTFSYYTSSSEGLQVLASNITSPGSGSDYSANPRTIIKYPFNFGDTLTDAWQTVGGESGVVKVTYLSYGTLITPNSEYEGVVCLFEEFADGTDCRWILLDPFWSIAAYDHVLNKLYVSEINTTLVESEGDVLPTNYLLHQNYPNPFNPSTLISFETPTRAFVVLTVFDVLGREVQTLINEQMSAGRHAARFSAANLPSGTYFYRLRAGSFVGTKKLTLLR
jgi:hypothetical protein